MSIQSDAGAGLGILHDQEVEQFMEIRGGKRFRTKTERRQVVVQLLGLKWEERKQPMPTTVIDHIEKPSES